MKKFKNSRLSTDSRKLQTLALKYLVILIFWQKDEECKYFDVDWIKEVMGRGSWIAKETKGNDFGSRSQGRLGGTSSKHR